MSIHFISILLSIFIIAGCTPEFKFPDNTVVRNESVPDNPNDTDGDGRDDENDPDENPDEEPRVPSYGRHESCLSIHKSNPSLKDGHYYIDHDWDLDSAYVNVFCDMTNGGWTEIIGSESNLNFEELQKMCDIKSIKKTLYSDRSKGVGWGLGQKNYCRSCMTCDLFTFMDVKVTLSAKAKHDEVTDRSKGYLWIPNRRYRNGWQVIEFNDRFRKDSSGSNELYVNTVQEIDRFPIKDTINHHVSAPYNSYGDLTVCMGGEKNYYYNKRFIKNLRVK